GVVFDYGRDQVIKIYGNASRTYLEHLAALQREIVGHALPFATPLIHEISEIDGVHYTRERRLNGMRIEPLFPMLDAETQRRALTNFFSVLPTLNSISYDHAPNGQAMQMGGFVHASTWSGFLTEML
ncbi:MAG: hypothetical protein H0X24_20035, partial [Ktedonobacterales bacterium]|nr:hypothetical protein [Ktedonobacterales bacterium]